MGRTPSAWDTPSQGTPRCCLLSRPHVYKDHGITGPQSPSQAIRSGPNWVQRTLCLRAELCPVPRVGRNTHSLVAPPAAPSPPLPHSWSSVRGREAFPVSPPPNSPAFLASMQTAKQEVRGSWWELGGKPVYPHPAPPLAGALESWARKEMGDKVAEQGPKRTPLHWKVVSLGTDYTSLLCLYQRGCQVSRGHRR